jgi:hypothetical protein
LSTILAVLSAGESSSVVALPREPLWDAWEAGETMLLSISYADVDIFTG